MNIYKIHEEYNVSIHKQFIEYTMSNFGIQGLEIDALSFIYQHNETNQISLGKELGLSRTRVSRLVDKLEAKDLVIRKQNPDNKREKIIVFAPRTYSITENYIKLINDLDDKVSKEITEEEVIIFQKVLSVMYEQIKKANYEDL